MYLRVSDPGLEARKVEGEGFIGFRVGIYLDPEEPIIFSVP